MPVSQYGRLGLFSDEEKARVVVGDIFSRVWDDYDILDRRQIKAYLMRAVHNRAIDLIRREKKHQAYLSEMTKMKHIDDQQWFSEREGKIRQIEGIIYPSAF